ncbi:hypothetical protein [Escherichia coli]|uniref:hypothetical protein n=1 Tax=Escherichia coli TaxID=562 RepID=UPI00345A7E84
MPETIELPPEDIRDFVAIQHDADGKIRVKVVEAKKHITSVQRYLTLLRSRYPGKISKFDFTTLDVIATLNSNNTERAPGVLSDGGINTVQRKVLDYISAKWHLNRSWFGIRIDHDLACFRSLIGILPPTPGINSFHHSLHCRV